MKATLITAAVAVGLAAPAAYGAALAPAATAAPRLERRVFPTDSAAVAAFLSTVQPDQLSTYFSWAANGDAGFVSHAQSFTSANAAQYSSYLAAQNVDPAEASAILGGIGTRVGGEAPAPTGASGDGSNGSSSSDGSNGSGSASGSGSGAQSTDANGNVVGASTGGTGGSTAAAGASASGASATGAAGSAAAAGASGASSSASGAAASATGSPDGAHSTSAGGVAATVLAAVAAYLLL